MTGEQKGTELAAAVFASGGGSNLQSLLDHQSADPPWRIRLVVADRPGIGALERAERAGVATAVIRTKERRPEAVAAETLEVLGSHSIDVVFLAGYLKLLPAPVIATFRRRILNIHPAPLPAFGGKGMYGIHVHRAVLASGSRLSGPTVHLVDEEYDRGAILAQWPVPVLVDDTPETLAGRVLQAEHLLYPLVADHLCRTIIDGRDVLPLEPSGEAFTLVREMTDSVLGRLGEGGRGDVTLKDAQRLRWRGRSI